MSSLGEFLRRRRNEKYTTDQFGNKTKRKKAKPTVKDIKISKKYLPLRIILFVLFLGGGIAGISVAVSQASVVNKGWKEIEVNGGKTASSNFKFMYYFSSDDGHGNGSVYKNLCNNYTIISQKSYFVFSSIEETSGTNNIYYLNHHINEEVEVDPILYKTLKKLDDANNKVIYMAPIYSQYRNLYSASSEEVAKSYDPYYSTNAETLYKSICDYINNGDIYFSYPSENKVILNVTDEYKTFAQQNGFSKYVDMSYIENAASIDYYVEWLEENGFKNYRISSYEGYSRSGIEEKSASSFSFSYNYYAWEEEYIMPSCVVKFNKPISLIEFKKFPVSSMEDYYMYKDKTFVHHFLNQDNGKYMSATDSLYLYDDGTTPLLDILINGSKVFVNDSFDKEALKATGYKYIYHVSNKIKYNQENLNFTSFLTVNICNQDHTAFSSTTCPTCQGTDFKVLKFEKELD